MLTMPDSMQKNAAAAYTNVQAQTPMARQPRTSGAQKAQETAASAQSSQVAGDNAYEVLPGESRKGTGIYSLKRDESGAQQISFDRPARYAEQIASELLSAMPSIEATAAQKGSASSAPAGGAASQGAAAPSTSEEDAAPQKAAASGASKVSAAPQKAGGGTTASTDQVDAEIERLKQKEQRLEKQAASSDPEKKEAVKAELARVKSELRMKDNDTYRRSNTKFTNG